MGWLAAPPGATTTSLASAINTACAAATRPSSASTRGCAGVDGAAGSCVGTNVVGSGGGRGVRRGDACCRSCHRRLQSQRAVAAVPPAAVPTCPPRRGRALAASDPVALRRRIAGRRRCNRTRVDRPPMSLPQGPSWRRRGRHRRVRHSSDGGAATGPAHLRRFCHTGRTRPSRPSRPSRHGASPAPDAGLLPRCRQVSSSLGWCSPPTSRAAIKNAAMIKEHMLVACSTDAMTTAATRRDQSISGNPSTPQPPRGPRRCHDRGQSCRR